MVRKLTFDLVSKQFKLNLGTADGLLAYREKGFCISIESNGHDMREIKESLECALEMVSPLVELEVAYDDAPAIPERFAGAEIE